MLDSTRKINREYFLVYNHFSCLFKNKGNAFTIQEEHDK